MAAAVRSPRDDSQSHVAYERAVAPVDIMASAAANTEKDGIPEGVARKANTMGKVKLLLCAVLAIAAVGVVEASAASAASCVTKKTSGHVAICIAGKVLGSGTKATIAGQKKASTASKLEVTGGPTVVCSGSTATGELEGGGETASGTGKNVVLAFTGCEVTNTAETKANCEVPNISTKKVVASFTGEEASAATFTPESGTEFATVVIKNKAEKACTFKTAGSKVTGTQKCALPKALTELEIQELACATSGSALKYGATENTAVFELTGEFWLGTATTLTKQLFGTEAF